MSDSTEFDVDDKDETQAIHDFDYGRVMLLLSVMEKQTLVAPRSTSIFGIAQAALEEMNLDAKAIARARADRIKEADTKARAAEQARVDAEREEHEAALRPRAIPTAQLRAHPEPKEPEPEMQPGEPTPKRSPRR